MEQIHHLIGIFIALSIFVLFAPNAFGAAANQTYNIGIANAATINSIPIMSAPSPATCTVASTSETYSNTAKPYILQSPVCKVDITIDSGVTVITNNQSMTATGTFTINPGGILEGTGAAPGGGCAGVDCSSTGTSGTVTELGGGTGGAGIHGTYGTSGSGGGGANAGSNIPGGTCGTAQTCAQGGSNGGGGGGGTVASALTCQNSQDAGGAGGGKVLIYAGNFLNYGTISVAGVSASNNGQGVNDAGGGGGGGYVLLYIESANPSNIDIGDVYANGGNGGLAHSDSCGLYGALTQYGEAGGGGGGGNVTIYVLDQHIKNSIDTNAVNVNGGSSGACYTSSDCTTASTGDHGTIYVATLVPNGCLPGITGNLFTSGSCTFYANDTITTTYNNGVVGNGQISAQKASVTSTASMTGNIVAFNSQNAQWLLTCPITPNPSNTLEYMISDASSFVGGNRCLANNAPLTSKVQLETYAYWNDSNPNTQVANAVAYVTFQNLGSASISNLGYSGEANTTNEPAPFLSSNYNTQSYIFNYVPPSVQSGLWTWNAKYADLSNAKLSNSQPLQQKTETIQNLQFTTGAGCTYIYNFQVSAQLNSIQNANIPVPVALKNIPSNYIEFTGTGLKYYPAISQPVPDNCAEELWADPLGEQQVTCGGDTFNIISPGDVLLNWTGSSNPNLPKGAYGGNNAYTSTSYPNDYITSVDYQTPGCIFLGASFCTNNNYYTFSAPTGVAKLENSPIYPYLLYNISIPSTETNIGHGTSDLNLSFDIYSPHNTFSPANYIEPYGLSTGSGFFATLHTSSGSYLAEYPINWTASNTVFDKPTTNFISAISNAAAGALGGLSNLFLGGASGGAIGSFSNGKITQPSFIASTSNDHIYILNYTSRSTGCFIACTGSNTKTFLYTMRFIPAGYFNISNFQPNFTEGSVTPSASSWNSIWTSYWDNIINIQSKDLYITNVTKISSTTTNACGLFDLSSCTSGSSGADFSTLIPTALTSDYAGDTFILGQKTSDTSSYEVSAIFANKTYATNSLKAESGFSPVSQIAATPGGQYIYVSNSTGNVSMFKTAEHSITFAGYINLAYSNYTDNLSITSYLQHGGPYANSLIAQAYSNAPVSNDINFNHVPIGIASYDGILYELDNWSFTVNDLRSSILMLRAFSANGTEVPIKAQSYSDIIPNNVPTVDLSTGGSGITYFPPFGWPLSANISIGNGNYITYCAANCDFTPANIPASKADGYLPIGPSISNQGNVGPNSDDMGFTSNFNGTMMILAHVHSYTYSDSGLCVIRLGCNTAGGSIYTELLKFKPVIINYTKVSFAQNSTYSCFISNSIAVSNTPCTINYNIGDMYPPFTEVPSAFNYSTNEGSPTKYFSISSVLSSLFPTGVSSSSSTSANSAANTGNGLTDNSATDIYNTANSLISLGTISSIPQTYINSTIRGYFLVPYTASYSLSESWSPQSDPATSSSPSSCSAYDFPSPTTINYNGYSVGQFNYTSNQASLNSTIQGGYSYAQYLVNPKTYYNASLSDHNLIFPGAVNLAMLTNKLFGNTYINQSIGRLNGKVQLLSNPYVINATRGLLYNEFYVNQTATSDTPSGFTFPSIGYAGYALTRANVLNPIEYGASNAVLGNVNPYPGSNNLVFINKTSPSMVNLYSLYKKVSQLDLLFQGFPNNANVLGYNRFMYVFTDAFNNTIYMPLDVDLSNITSITLNPSIVINATNSNETEITVNGTAGYYSGVFGDKYVPLPAGDHIYVYYDTNINFFNSSVAPPSRLYFNYSDRCAFASNATGCQYADPLSSVTQGGYYIKEADAPTFHTQYNDTQNAQGVSTCSPSPTSLLSAHIPINCNIYGNYGLPTSISAGNSPNNEPEYCLPEFANGTGVLTSQMGLVGVVNTNNMGQFSEKFNVCGTGTAKVIAQYFGNPGPEPQIVYQPPIGESIGSYAAQNANSINTLEYAYTTSPNATAVSFDIGNYALGFGGISIGLTMVIAIFAIIFLLSRRGTQNVKKR